MSTLSQFFGGGGVKSVQVGYSFTASPSTGSGQDTRYLDVAISAVVVAKSMVILTRGGAFPNESASWEGAAFDASARLVNSTTLRIHCAAAQSALSANWQVVEFN